MPRIPEGIQVSNTAGPHGFPLWIRYCHFFNFFFVMILIRSGLSILMDHPRLYFNDGCTPGTEWIRLTPITVHRDRLWTGERRCPLHIAGCGHAGYRHTIGIARVWHFITVHGFIVTGILFAIMLFDTNQWRRIVPTSGSSCCKLGVSSCTTPRCICRRSQTASTDTTPYSRSHISASSSSSVAGNPDRNRHVTGSGEPFSLVRPSVWRKAVGTVASTS